MYTKLSDFSKHWSRMVHIHIKTKKSQLEIQKNQPSLSLHPGHKAPPTEHKTC